MDIERVNKLSAEERKIFDEHFQEHMQEKNTDEFSARKQALEDVEKVLLAKAEAERKAREAEERNRKNIERVNQLSGYEAEFFYDKFQEHMNLEPDENSAREKALADVDEMLKAQAEAERRAAEEEQARLIAEQKAREEEERRAAEEEKTRLEIERKAREEEQRVASWGDKAQVKNYLENIQPFALTNFIKNQSGITGPLANGEIKALQNHAFAMSALAQKVQSQSGEVSRQVAIYFKCEAELASHYISVKKGGLGLISGAQLPDTYSRQNDAEKKIREMAAWCGADLSNFAETELLRRIVERLKK